MAASGTLKDCLKAVTDELADLGLPAVTDPRNVRPGAIFVELPVLNAFTFNVLDVTIPLRVCGTPPGNKDSADWVITTVDKIINSPIAITDGRPTTVEIGGQSLPAYDLTARISVKRN
jgi:hypothetical protein